MCLGKTPGVGVPGRSAGHASVNFGMGMRPAGDAVRDHGRPDAAQELAAALAADELAMRSWQDTEGAAQQAAIDWIAMHWTHYGRTETVEKILSLLHQGRLLNAPLPRVMHFYPGSGGPV